MGGVGRWSGLMVSKGIRRGRATVSESDPTGKGGGHVRNGRKVWSNLTVTTIPPKVGVLVSQLVIFEEGDTRVFETGNDT